VAERISYVFVSTNREPPELSAEVDGLGISAVTLLFNDMAEPDGRNVTVTAMAVRKHESSPVGP
jgi:hypothetical protein